MEAETTHITPYLKSLDTFVKGLISQGYTTKFTEAGDGLLDPDNNLYDQAQINVISTMHFEGNDSLLEHAELYVIETSDGRKGILSSRPFDETDLYQ